MSGITFVLNIAREALMAQQRGINVTGHNIANVNTPGFTRQRLILTANAVTEATRLKLGLGVKSESVVQYFDRLTTKQIGQRTSTLSEYEAKQSILEYLQGLFNEESGNGLNKTLEDFWNGWQDLANNPAGIAERTALLQKTNNMSQRFHTLYNGLVQTQNEMNTNLKISLNELNTFTQQVASLNERIVASEASGTTANDLRDQRISLIEKMSQLVDTTYLESDNGSMMVLTASGIPLVDGNKSWELEQEGQNIYWSDIPTDITSRLSGGKIGAWLELRDAVIPQYMADLDELAGTMIYQVNQLHFDGFALDGSTGKTFFVLNTGDDYTLHTKGDFSGAAGRIALSPDVDGLPENVAASSATGGSGNNENALAIQAIQDDGTLTIRKWTYQRGELPSSRDQTGTMDEYYTIFVGDIGMLVEETGLNQSFNQTMIDKLNEIRDSISGVNLDEETVNLIKYQHAFTAASKLVTVSDEMLQDLLKMR